MMIAVDLSGSMEIEDMRLLPDQMAERREGPASILRIRKLTFEHISHTRPSDQQSIQFQQP